MFASRYFPDRMFAPRYWPKVGLASSVIAGPFTIEAVRAYQSGPVLDSVKGYTAGPADLRAYLPGPDLDSVIGASS